MLMNKQTNKQNPTHSNLKDWAHDDVFVGAVKFSSCPTSQNSPGMNPSWASKLPRVCLGVKHARSWRGVERGEEITGIHWNQMAPEIFKGGGAGAGCTDSYHPWFLVIHLASYRIVQLSRVHKS